MSADEPGRQAAEAITARDALALPSTVMVVDDQATSRSILEQIARSIHEHVTVHAFSDPRDAMEWATRCTADLALIDYDMPHLNGIDVIKRLRSLPGYIHVPIIMVTANETKEVRYAALDVGVTDFLNKPIDIREYLARCKNLMTLRQQQLLLEDKVHELAYFDALTGLANRSLLLKRAELLIDADDKRAGMALIVLDLERFKNINDSLGRQKGDALLRQVGQFLSHEVGGANRLARVGPDQFAVVLPGVDGQAAVSRHLAQWMERLGESSFAIDDDYLRLTARAGIALFPEDASEAEALLRKAETALQKAKKIGDRYLFYAPSMTSSVHQQLTLENEMRQALDRKEFLLHYQPKVDAESGYVTSLEALIRWQHPARGLVSPAAFIPLLEETGMIVEVGSWVLRQAVLDHQRWTEQGFANLRVAVNVSALQLQRAEFVDMVQEAVALGAQPPGIDLEITESLIMVDVEAIIAKLKAVRRLGVGIAVDDFGTGYSSLAYLVKLPAQTLKIDRLFVSHMTTDPEHAQVTTSIIGLAKSLNLRVVAEGVETQAQASLLRAKGCDELQGYLFARPMPFLECSQLLAADNRLLSSAGQPDHAAATVLLVDDDPNDIELVRRALSPSGYRILEAPNATAAFEVLASEKVDVVISDHDMRHMTGVELLAKMSTLYPGVVRIVMSGLWDVALISEAVNTAGVYKYLSKNWPPERLRSEVREAVLRGASQAVQA